MWSQQPRPVAERVRWTAEGDQPMSTIALPRDRVPIELLASTPAEPLREITVTALQLHTDRIVYFVGSGDKAEVQLALSGHCSIHAGADNA